MASQFEQLVGEWPETSYVARRFGRVLGDPDTGPVLLWRTPARLAAVLHPPVEPEWVELVGGPGFGSVLATGPRRAADRGRGWVKTLVKWRFIRELAIGVLIRLPS